MHIVVVNNVYPPIAAGGAELIVAWLSEGLAARGHQVTVVSTCGPEMEPYPVETRNGVRVIRFFPRNVYWNFARQGQPSHRRVLWHLRDAWNADAGRQFHAILTDTPADIVHTHLIDGLSAAIWRRARQAGLPVLHTAHDYHLLCPRAFLLTRNWQLCREPQLACRAYRAWHLHTARDIDLFVSPSRFLLERHLSAGLTPRRSMVVRNGIPLPKPALRTRPGGKPTRRRLLLLTRLTVEKGVHVLLQAVATLPRTLGFELIIAGRGPLEPDVQQAAAADERIKFVGYVTGDAKDALLASADYLVLPSLWYENAPVVVIEAAAYGLGVIGSRIGGIPELVREGRTGLLFEPGNAKELAGALRRLLGEDAALPELADEARILAEEHSVDRMVGAYLECYRGLLPQRTPAAQPDDRSAMELRDVA
jgi:glycosyltransferase involved in cell wall biosynthesis